MNLFTDKTSLDTLILIIEGMGTIIVLMMGGICYFIIATAKMINRKNDQQDDQIGQLAKFMRDQQKQITELTNKMNKTVELIGVNQENDAHRMEFMEKLILQRTSG